MRSVVRALGALLAVFTAVPALVLAIPSAPASAGELRQQQPARADAAGTSPLAISITGMTPQVATPGATIRLSGTLANHTGSAVTGISVQALTSSELFTTRSDMVSYADDPASTYRYGVQSAGLPMVTGSVPNGATVRWTVTYPADDFYDQFGVFPVQVNAATPGSQYTAQARTFLPFWPSDSASQPKQLKTAWIWPLVDTPQQGACGQTLATSQLSRSVAPGGRLSRLLDVGAGAAATNNLTWDIDPALLSDVSVMTRSYGTLGNADCTGRFKQPPSKAAAQWLTKLKTTTAGQPAFLAPYANVDVAALSHAGLEQNVRSAYRLGETVAGQVLPATFGKDGSGTGDGAVLKAAWPAGGLADAGVLTSLATDGGISTVVLSSGAHQLQSATGYDDALGRTTNSIGTPMSALLADAGITSLLGSASARPTPSSQFALTQEFLAQTAMISSEAPNLARTLVIAPPTNWAPSAAEATALLAAAKNAKWLRPVGLSALAAQAAKLPSVPAVPKQVSHAELSGAYVSNIREVTASLSVFKSLLYKPSAGTINSLDAALAATESSAWRGAGSEGGWLAYSHLNKYLDDAEHSVQIITGNKILLAGVSGVTPISVKNDLTVPVQVRVAAVAPPGSSLEVRSFNGLLKVLAGQTNTAHVPLHSTTIGTTTLQLQLVTRDGSPLAWTEQSLSVEVTRVGRFLLTIIGGALGILVLTSAVRLRRKRLASARQRAGNDDTANTGGAG